mgnify:CR=1 FL=1
MKKTELKRIIKTLIQESLGTKYYHVSTSKIDVLSPNPIWVDLSSDYLASRVSNMLEGGNKNMYKYEITMKTNSRFLTVKDGKELFKEKGIDYLEYIDNLVGAPNHSQVLNEDGTKLLRDEGYDGIIHFDYDPDNFQNSIKTMLVIDPTKTFESFKLLK